MKRVDTSEWHYKMTLAVTTLKFKITEFCCKPSIGLVHTTYLFRWMCNAPTWPLMLELMECAEKIHYYCYIITSSHWICSLKNGWWTGIRQWNTWLVCAWPWVMNDPPEWKGKCTEIRVGQARKGPDWVVLKNDPGSFYRNSVENFRG